MSYLSKVYKKGTKIRFFWSANSVGTKDYEDFVLENDYTYEELQDISVEYMQNNLQPESWFVAEDEEGYDNTGNW